MNSLPIKAIAVAGTAALAAAALGSISPAVGIAVAAMAALGFVAFAAQSERLRDGDRLVYRPVYVRRHDDRRRVRSDD